MSIAFYGFTREETQHMKEVTIENGGTPVSDLSDPSITHIVINDQEVKQLPINNLSNDEQIINTSSSSAGPREASTTTSSSCITANTAPITPTSSNKHSNPIYIDLNTSPFSNTRASIVRAEWFWASIQICCRASECLYEFVKVSYLLKKQLITIIRFFYSFFFDKIA